MCIVHTELSHVHQFKLAVIAIVVNLIRAIYQTKACFIWETAARKPSPKARMHFGPIVMLTLLGHALLPIGDQHRWPTISCLVTFIGLLLLSG